MAPALRVALPRLCYSGGVVVEGAVRARLRALEQVAAHLEELARLGPEGLRASVRDRWAAERGLELALAGVLDAGRGLLGEIDSGTDEPAAGLIDRLARAGVLTAGLRARLGELTPWRDRLRLPDPSQDPDRLVDALAHAARELADFDREARIWLAMELLPDEDEPEPAGGAQGRELAPPLPETPASGAAPAAGRQEAAIAAPLAGPAGEPCPTGVPCPAREE